jgi:hypothetical protein
MGTAGVIDLTRIGIGGAARNRFRPVNLRVRNRPWP